MTTRPGTVLSADIAVPEHERELRFYAQVLRTGPEPLWSEDLTNNQGIPVIGVGARTPEYEKLPLQWMPHIQVSDVGTSTSRAEQLGGSVMMHHRNEEGTSQWAVLLDPNGAAFGIVPVVPAEMIPPGHGTMPDDSSPSVGRIGWLDLTVPDAAATRDFYREVIGWTSQELEIKHESGNYADFMMLDGEGNPAAGVCHTRGPNADLPPVWLIYLPVADLAESVRRVGAEGGKVIKEMRGKDGALSYAVIEDAVGATFALIPG